MASQTSGLQRTRAPTSAKANGEVISRHILSQRNVVYVAENRPLRAGPQQSLTVFDASGSRELFEGRQNSVAFERFDDPALDASSFAAFFHNGRAFRRQHDDVDGAVFQFIANLF